ncbi:MAG: hypothetical protein OXB96_00250 [Candidatus Kaiserbacteria bacterium]|nr:hypothetical protein [Candidatus Kaiserbacteria bacterium]
MLLWTADFKYVGFFNHQTQLAGYVDPDLVDNHDEEDLSEKLAFMTVFLAQQRTKEIEHDGKFFTVWDNEVDWDASIGNNEGANTATRFIQREIEAQGLPIHLHKQGSKWHLVVEHQHWIQFTKNGETKVGYHPDNPHSHTGRHKEKLEILRVASDNIPLWGYAIRTGRKNAGKVWDSEAEALADVHK